MEAVMCTAMAPNGTLVESPEPAAEAAADARAEADVAAGRRISHEAVKTWVSSRGSDRHWHASISATDLRRMVWTDDAVAHLEAIVIHIAAFNPYRVDGETAFILSIRHGARDEEETE